MSVDNHQELQKFIDLSEHYRTYLEEHGNIRPDGRSFNQDRPVEILRKFLKHSYGSSMIRFGNTSIICSITGQLTRPSLRKPKAGFVQTVVLLPRRQAWSNYGRRQQIINENAILNQHLLDIILKSELIDLESLCIEEGKWVWCLQIDFQCLNDDGNLFDSCLFALNIALRHAMVPTVEVDLDTQKPMVYTKKMIPLKYNEEQEPLCCSLAIYKQNDDFQFLIDPTAEEENIADSVIHYVLLKNDKICLMHKTGGAPFSAAKFRQCYSLAHDYIAQLRRKLIQ